MTLVSAYSVCILLYDISIYNISELSRIVKVNLMALTMTRDHLMVRLIMDDSTGLVHFLTK